MPADNAATSASAETAVLLIDRDDLPSAVTAALSETAIVAPADVVVVDLVGAGAVACAQGILTNDVEAGGEHGFLYGAVLTPKGMIICDLWVARAGNAIALFAPSTGREALFGMFKRSLPPRLARPEERTDSVTVLRVAGPHALECAERAGLAVPAPGTAGRGRVNGADVHVGRTGQDQPFVLQLLCAAAAGGTVRRAFEAAGAVPTTKTGLELARILSGWPRLGAEIDRKTLPQEARFDALEGVSYTKGCYTGQETVARLHFRGHTNRQVTGLMWNTRPDPGHPQITAEDKPVGRVSSIAWLDRAQRYAGLGMVRTTVRPGAVVTAAGAPARTVDVPFDFDA